jgi:hypothetical protein
LELEEEYPMAAAIDEVYEVLNGAKGLKALLFSRRE